VGYNPQTHVVAVDSPEDALSVPESRKDLALSMKGGKEVEKNRWRKRCGEKDAKKKRKAKRKDFE
jgi:hypothetical protein